MEYLEQLISSKQNVHDVQSEQPQLKSLPPLKQPTIERSQQVSSLQTSSNLYDEMTSVKTTASTSSSETGDSAYMDVTESPENIYVEARVKPITYIEYAAKYQVRFSSSCMLVSTGWFSLLGWVNMHSGWGAE